MNGSSLILRRIQHKVVILYCKLYSFVNEMQLGKSKDYHIYGFYVSVLF